MDYEDFDTEDIEDYLWADFWSKGATDYENHEVYRPAIIRSPGGRKPGYGLLSDLGVRKCTPA